MDGEAGAQVAAPIFMSLPGQFLEASAPLLAKKRDFPWQNQQQLLQMSDAFPNPSGNWNPNRWEWDSLSFTAKPSSSAAAVVDRATQTQPASTWGHQQQQQQQKKVMAESSRSPISGGGAEEEDGDSLTLKLGRVNYSSEEQPAAARPSKRVRSGSPGNGGGGGSHPMCQVDDCRSDLSGAKDYHRRHKVCELHSKTTKALVAKQMQRFCQQCSRFHPLSEFDEGKRSCRRRLAGHNRRRRKTQPEEPPSRFMLPRNQENPISGNLDIMNLLTMLTRMQGNNLGKPAGIPPLPDRDQILQLLKKLNTLNNANPPSRSSAPGDFDLNVSQAPQQGPLDQSSRTNDLETSPSTMNLLAVLSAALSASSPEALASLSQGSSENSGNDKPALQNVLPAADDNLQTRTAQNFPTSRVGRNDQMSVSPLEASQKPVQGPRQSQPLQLFSSAGDDSPPKVGSAVKYLSSESSNPMEDRSPSSSPPVTQRLFPLHSAAESLKHAQESNGIENNAAVELSTNRGWDAPLDLFRESRSRVERGAVHSVLYQAGYTSSSGSDHSPSSSVSDPQDRTGRIIFKLFGKDPNTLPGTLRAQILNWLSNSPSEMESHIRPGCVVLSIYISMPSIAWEELENDLLPRVTSLTQHSDSNQFWQDGRLLVRTNRQLVSYKDGKFRLSKSWRAWVAPEVTFVSPVAVVSGQETTLVIKGRNLTIPGTKIHCTYMGKYMSKEVLCSTDPGTIYDDSSTERFEFPGGFPWIFGRCFIEVENSFKGNSFPVIIADASICQELRTLESDFEEDARSAVSPEDQVQDNARPLFREDLLHFLNELGWLFQKTHVPHDARFHDFSTTRFRHLLIFSVERGFCALIKVILDIMVERSSGSDILKQESMEMLSEIHLLNRAVKRKYRRMVDLLLHYSLSLGDGGTRVYIFPPDMAGPGGVTPLHLAASTQDSDDVIDALTSDPQGIGLECWNSLQDDNGETPFTCALIRNHHSYNKAVRRKLADRENGQITLSVVDEESSLVAESSGPPDHTSRATSCAQCALIGSGRSRRTTRAQGMLQRSYVLSMLAIAAVCVCVCIFYRASPNIKWDDLEFGSI